MRRVCFPPFNKHLENFLSAQPGGSAGSGQWGRKHGLGGAGRQQQLVGRTGPDLSAACILSLCLAPQPCSFYILYEEWRKYSEIHPLFLEWSSLPSCKFYSNLEVWSIYPVTFLCIRFQRYILLLK